jgi:hypothetical protein
MHILVGHTLTESCLIPFDLAQMANAASGVTFIHGRPSADLLANDEAAAHCIAGSSHLAETGVYLDRVHNHHGGFT